MTEDVGTAIIGSGFGGLGMAIQLGRAGLGPFTIFERDQRLGGTWRDNSYPGAACDVPSHLYSFSFAPKHDWSRRFPEQGEILAYLEEVARAHDLLGRIRFGTAIVSARFDEAAARWTLTSAAGETFRARVLIVACGQLNRPQVPSLPGADRFAGAQLHSARWDASLPLDGRRVAVIGTGASAVQLVPPVAARAARLTLFQRSAPWIIAKPDRAYHDLEKRLFAALPWVQGLSRLAIYARFESRYLVFRSGGGANRLAQKMAQRYLAESVPDPTLRAALTPDYPIGCKRILISNDYYPALARPNVTLCTDPIAALEPDAVVTRGGARHLADVLIYATGFKSTELLAPLEITGRGGRDLNADWRAGAEAYLGISVTGFPNLFVLYGPNTNLAHNSIVFMLEAQIRYVLACLRAMRDLGLRWLDVRAERARAYNAELERRLAGKVWAEGCTSWYKTASGKNTNNWPGSTLEYAARTRRLDLDDYDHGHGTGDSAPRS